MIYTIGLALLGGLAIVLLFLWRWEYRERMLFELDVERLMEEVEGLQQKVQKYKREAGMDELTGLSNRRALMRGSRQMYDALARAARGDGLDRELVIVVMDVRRFKEENDNHGHAAGDELLRELAGALKDALQRPTDLVGRLGGDEFAAALELSGSEDEIEEQVGEVEERLRTRLDPIHRVDIGVAACGFADGAPMELEEVWKLADQRMYAAKQKAR